MKNSALICVLAILSVLPMVVSAADYQNFVSPNSLGKNIKELNKKYQLGLKVDKDYDLSYEKMVAYTNAGSKNVKCYLSVKATKQDVIKSINLFGPDCQFKTNTPIAYHHRKSTSTSILNQVKFNDVRIVPGCYNCPSGIELFDDLIVENPKNNYRLIFGMQGYNQGYHIALSKLLFKSYNENNHYEYMDKLEDFFDNNPNAHKSEGVKKLAMKYYQNNAIYEYTIESK